MSYIRDLCVCECCGKSLQYAWLYPDAKMERVPTGCILAGHDSFADKYLVTVKCDNCNQITAISYTKTGKRM